MLVISNGQHAGCAVSCNPPNRRSKPRIPRSSVKVEAFTSSKGATIPLFVAGATLGTLLDGIHGTVHLLQYKVGAYVIGGLHSSIWVSPLLATFYGTIGIAYVFLDQLASTASEGCQERDSLRKFLNTPGNVVATQAALKRISAPYLLLNTGATAGLLYLSAVLYQAGWPYAQIFAVLALAAGVNYCAFDGTRQGLVLAAFCALAAPVSELLLINYLGMWRYPYPDIFGAGGIPSWITCCYFFYTVGVGNFARLLHRGTESND